MNKWWHVVLLKDEAEPIRVVVNGLPENMPLGFCLECYALNLCGCLGCISVACTCRKCNCLCDCGAVRHNDRRCEYHKGC